MPPLIGRERELARALSAFDAAIEGRGSIVLIDGEPGVGKTRLARELLTIARSRGAQVFVGRCFEQYAAVPFLPFGEGLGNADLAKLAEVRTRFPELAYIVPGLSDAPAHARGDAPRQLQIFRAATAFLHAVAQDAPLVLLLDDLQWADATSLDLLLHLGRHVQASPMLILGTYRDVEVGRHHPLEQTLSELVRERIVDEIHLGGLSYEESASLIRSALSSEAVPDAFVRLIHARAEGNPFFTEELLKTAPSGSGELDIPRSIRSVIGRRVGNLPAHTQDLLHLASVLGQEFELDALIAASERSEAECLDGLDAALAVHVLEERRIGSRERLAFTHALLQQTLYSELSAHHRRRLHQRAGEALEALGGPRRVAADLARHFLASHATERAIRYTTEAGDQAAARFAHAEAAQQYTLTLELLHEREDPALAASVRLRLGDELVDLSRREDAQAAYEAALIAFEHVGDKTSQALVHRGIARLHVSLYDITSAVLHFDAALRLWPTERADVEFAGLLMDAARANAYGVNRLLAAEFAERALGVVEGLGNVGLLARALIEVAATLQDVRPRTAEPLLTRAEALARGINAWRILHRLHLVRGVKAWMAGEHEQALAERMHAAEAAERSGEAERAAYALQVVAGGCHWLGLWAQGRAAIHSAIARDPERIRDMPAMRAALAWMEGRTDDAQTLAQAGVASGKRRGDVQDVFYHLGALAEFALETDRPVVAEWSAREAMDLIRSGEFRALQGFGLGPFAETMVRLGVGDAAEALAEAEQIMSVSEHYVARPQLLRARGLLLQRAGELDGALELFQASAAEARSQHARIQLGRTLAVCNSLARARGNKSLANQINAERRELVEFIGPEVRGLAWAKGLSNSRPPGAADSAPLSRREQEVALAIAAGHSNRTIAELLVISERTVENHVSSILGKLAVDSRAQIAVWATQRGLAATKK